MFGKTGNLFNVFYPVFLSLGLAPTSLVFWERKMAGVEGNWTFPVICVTLWEVPTGRNFHLSAAGPRRFLVELFELVY